MKKVVTVCPYCASGCKINLVVDNGKIVRAEAAQGKTNQGTLCLKGYYGWDFINDTQILTPRLKTPMIRRQRGGKLEPVSWDEALNYRAPERHQREVRSGCHPDDRLLAWYG
ncbi:molybdopterin oxidoreductase family protein [Escherichia coli 2-210-07_S1_C2]|nr:molybdopterin oxidoreductase family protein [Escherichia coli 2-210-07_S1_C3]KDW92750.1 molybdopterin oxidoreductase family protein [Escherichia coli 2-210-07_S1_C2]